MEQKNTDMGKAFRVALSIVMPKEDSEKNEYSEENEKHGYNDLDLYPAEKMYVDSMYEIVDKYGKLADNDNNGIWVGYMSPAENENKSIGVKCSNCAFWCSEMMNCHIITLQAQPNGLCRLAAIGNDTVKGKRK
jgi:hypothetical protein